MRVLRVPGFGALLAGQAVNAIGNWVAIIAIWGFAAFEFDATAGDLALLFVLLSLPGAIVGPALGVAIDRVGPRRTLIASNLVGLVTAMALTQADSYMMVIALALPLGMVEALAGASLDTLAPRMVPDEDLVTANALLGGAQDAAIVIGPIVAAVVHSRWGLSAAFLADAATFVVGAAVAFSLRVGHADATRVPVTARHELHEGLRVVRESPALRWTLAAATSTYALWAVAGILEPLFVRDVLQASGTTFALIQAVFGVGLVGTGLLVARLGNRLATPRVVAFAIIASGATAALYFGTRSLAVAYVGVFLWGVDVGFFLAPTKTLLQRAAPAHAHGRVLAINGSLEPAAALVMAPLAAVTLMHLDVQAVALLASALVMFAGVIALRAAPKIAPLATPAEASSRTAVSELPTAQTAVAPGSPANVGPAPG